MDSHQLHLVVWAGFDRFHSIAAMGRFECSPFLACQGHLLDSDLQDRTFSGRLSALIWLRRSSEYLSESLGCLGACSQSPRGFEGFTVRRCAMWDHGMAFGPRWGSPARLETRTKESNKYASHMPNESIRRTEREERIRVCGVSLLFGGGAAPADSWELPGI